MRVSNCEKVQRAIMECDEQTAMSTSEIDLHIKSCTVCRQEAEQLRRLDGMFKRHRRREHDVELWPAIQRKISLQPTRSTSWRPFAVLAVLLLTYRALELIAPNPPILLFNLVPIAIVFGLFALIRENPFRINSKLVMEMNDE
jgi:hypothetical protein